MKIIITKSELLVFGKNSQIKADVYLNNQRSDQVDEMLHLRSKMTLNGKIILEIKLLI